MKNVEVVNLRLVSKGRNALERMMHDNPNVLYSTLALNQFRSLIPRKENKSKPGRMKIDGLAQPYDLMNSIQEEFQAMVKNRRQSYNSEIHKVYCDLKKISPRSKYYYRLWVANTALYGRNNGKGFEKIFKTMGNDAIFQIFDDICLNFFDAEGLNLDGFVDNPEWTAHVKTGSNEGYAPDGGYQSQTKQGVFDIRWNAMKIYAEWAKDQSSIIWHKLSFAPTFRTERDDKARTISQGPKFEKVIAAIISWITRKRVDILGIQLPRIKGEMSRLCDDLLGAKQGTKYKFLAKDFDAFDANLPEILFRKFLEWLKARFYDEEKKSWANDFVGLVAFEVDLIIHSMLIIDGNKVLKLRALPSGVGLTQLLGSILHAFIDVLANFIFVKVYYQSDDTAGVPKMTESEINSSLKFIKNVLMMPISELGDKSFLGDFTIILQTWIDALQGIYYGNEIRRWTNLYFKERQQKNKLEEIAVALRLSMNKDRDVREIRRVVNALSYLGTVASLGMKAPMLSDIVSKVYGKQSGFTWSTIEKALPLLGVEPSGVFEKLTFSSKTFSTMWLELKENYGWNSLLKPLQVQKIAERY